MSHSLLLFSFLALLTAILVASLLTLFPQLEPPLLLAGVHLVGQLFLRALMLLVIPLVVAALIQGTMRLGATSSAGRLGLDTLLAFSACMSIAVFFGMMSSYFLAPSSLMNELACLAQQPGQPPSSLLPNAAAVGGPWTKVEQLLLQLVPQNVLAAASRGEIIGLIGFCGLFGMTLSQLGGTAIETVRLFWIGTFQLLVAMVQKLMKLMPLGLFALLLDALASSPEAAASWHCLLGLAMVLITTLLTFGLLLLVVVHLWIRQPIMRTLNALAAPLLTAFSSSSSAVALPLALEAMSELGVPNRISSLVLPLGTTINLAGSALYVAAVVAFVVITSGQATSISWPLVYGVTLITSMAMAGVPSAALIALMLVLQTLELPTLLIPYILAIDRFIDMVRTVINVLASSLVTLVLAHRTAGEEASDQ